MDAAGVHPPRRRASRRLLRLALAGWGVASSSAYTVPLGAAPRVAFEPERPRARARSGAAAALAALALCALLFQGAAFRRAGR